MSNWFAPDGQPPPVGLKPDQIAQIFSDERRGTWLPLFPLALQPLVMPHKSFHELLCATTDMMDLLRKAVWHSADDREGRIAALGIDPSDLPFFVSDEDFEWRHCTDMARADVVITPDGPQFLEINVGGSIGGMPHGDFYLRGWRKVAEQAGVLPYLGVDIWSRIAALVERNCATLGIPPSVLLVDQPNEMDKGTNTDSIRQQLDGLRARGVWARHVEPAGLPEEIGLPGPLRETLCLAEFNLDDAKASGIDLSPVRTALDAGLRMIPSQTSQLLTSKKVLAWLSEGQPWMNEEERALVDRFVPWTRTVSDRAVWWRGRRYELPRLLTEHREMFVLKGSMGAMGREVVFGSRTEPADWAAQVEQAVDTGYPVAQQVVTPDLVPVDVMQESGEIVRMEANAVISPFSVGGAPAGCIARFMPAGPLGVIRRKDGMVFSCVMASA